MRRCAVSTTCFRRMALGIGTFNPSGQFSLTRSYFATIEFDNVSFVFAQTGRIMTATLASFPGWLWRWGIDQRFYDWSSNHWTLDHLLDISDATPPGGSPLAQPYILQAARYTGEQKFRLIVSNPFLSTGARVRMVIPGPAAPYWLPLWPDPD